MYVMILNQDPDYEHRHNNKKASKMPVIVALRKLMPNTGIKAIHQKVNELYKTGHVRFDIDTEPSEEAMKSLEGYGTLVTLHHISEKARDSLHTAVYIAINNLSYELAEDLVITLRKHF